ncbi:MAG: hypothetical protein ACKVWV_06830 [Planctomycetota bacterium]
MANVLQRVVLALYIGISASCASNATRISKLYQEFERDLADQSDVERMSSASGGAQQRRAADARAIAAAGELSTADELLKASILLVESDDTSDLELARTLGLQAAKLGEAKGTRVAAEAFDKQLLKQGMHQMYGTQYVRDALTGRWHLYPCDPRTTDADRVAMGVEPMAELVKKEAVLNARFRKPTPYELATRKQNP